MRNIDFLSSFANRHGLLERHGSPATGELDYAIYSQDEVYRYVYLRWWNTDRPLDLWVGLNPGVGDTELKFRPTLNNCIKRSRNRDTGGIIIANLFAYRHKSPRELRKIKDSECAVGPHNDELLRIVSGQADRTFVAWGNAGEFHNRYESVAPLLDSPLCLGVTASGQPRHPLYVSYETEALAWTTP